MKHVIDFFHAVENKNFFKEVPVILEETYFFNSKKYRYDFSGCVAKMMFMACDMGAWAFNIKTKDFFITEKAASIVGYSQKDLMETNIQKIKRIIDPEDFHSLENNLISHLNGESSHVSNFIRIQNKDKKWVKIYIKGRVVVENEQKNSIWLFGIVMKMDDIANYQDELRDLANYDSLTHLPNRKFLKEQLDIAIRNSQKDNSQLAICFIDLDGFKSINDTYGHHVGDKFLCEIADSLKKAVRNHDIVARLGGDEFVVVFNRVKEQNKLLFLLERLSKVCHKNIIINNNKFCASASIGVVVYPYITGSVDELISYADKSMYQSKFTKNKKYTFFHEIDDSYILKKSDPDYLFKRLVDATHQWFE